MGASGGREAGSRGRTGTADGPLPHAARGAHAVQGTHAAQGAHAHAAAGTQGSPYAHSPAAWAPAPVPAFTPPASREVTPLDHATRYVTHRRWDVFPGAWLITTAGVPRCCCGDTGCATPGAHPLSERWASEATGSASTARQLWGARPHASVLLPTGRTFDAVEVPDAAGCLALARLERGGASLGPVSRAPDGRMFFFVLPGGARRVPQLVRGLGWTPGGLDLAAHGENGWVAAPPTRLGTRGPLRWAREPTAANRWLPDVEELMPALAYACGQEAAAARGQ
jgi:hypothetical protein